MERYFIAALNAANYIGSKRLQLLINFFGSAEKVWLATDDELSETGLPLKALNSLLTFRREHPNAPENLVKFCENKKFKLCSFIDKSYPAILKEISSPPPVIYYVGNLQTDVNRIAIVGTRNATNYGNEIARQLAKDLAEAGVTVVSGAARGIDTAAHIGALSSGRTVAVLGCGINCMHKLPNSRLLEDIAEGGVVMSEFEPNMTPSPLTFPPRNRIIAGLCKGVIVVEAGAKSGALITCTYAGNYGREVFAVPGNIHSKMSEGCHNLIRDGATLITSAQDVLEQCKIPFTKVSNKKPPTFMTKKIDKETSIFQAESVKLEDNEKKIFDLIPTSEYIALDEILMQIDDISPEEINSIALSLEMKNLIVEDAGRYTRIN